MSRKRGRNCGRSTGIPDRGKTSALRISRPRNDPHDRHRFVDGKVSELGDSRWKNFLLKHNEIVRKELTRYRGHEVKTMGDGFLATFDGPARAIKCACSIRDEVKGLGIAIRAGLHTGECELIGDNDIGGVSVHVAHRVQKKAGPEQVLVSSTVKDLVSGSGIQFNDLGIHSLKGIPGEWRLFEVKSS
jgi:class 3 adenylate cyclase